MVSQSLRGMHGALVRLRSQKRRWLFSCLSFRSQISPGGPVVGIQIALKQAILGIHEAVGNVKTEGKTIVYAHGATGMNAKLIWTRDFG